MPLTSLHLAGCGQVQDLTPLKGMLLTTLNLHHCGQVRDLSPLKGMPLKSLRLENSGVTDLTPLTGMKLEDVYFTPKNITKGLDILESPGPLRPPQIGLALPVAALVLPVVAGSVLLFVTSSGLTLAISAAAVVGSSLLMAIDAGRLGRTDLKGRQRESAGLLFLGMCLLWIVVYPLAFFRRRHFSGPSLAIPALLVALFFVGGPLLRAVLVPPGLPACDSPEVVQLLNQVIRSTPAGARARSIDGHREVSYERVADRRQGQCVVHTDGGDIVVNYLVQWRDRAKGLFEVRIPPPELPSCTSREVVQLLEQVIRGTPIGAKARSIDGHREVSYDQAADRRQGQCVVHSDGADLPVNYVVQWRDREKGQFEVRITP
jgi:hypothetical protein